MSECTAMNSQSVKPSVGSIVYESDSAANATENNVQLIKHRVTEEGEICYGIYDPAFLKGIREKMPIQVCML